MFVYLFIYLHNIRNLGLILMKVQVSFDSHIFDEDGCSSVKQFVKHWVGSKLLSQP